MADYESREVRALKSISKAQKGPPKEFQKNMAQVNASIRYLSEYMVIMQKGIDDANKDIIQKIQDAIDELIILFGGGTALEDVFDFGNIEVFFDNLNAIFDVTNLTDPITDNPILVAIINQINAFIADMLSALDGATGGVFNLDDLADRLKVTESTAVQGVSDASVAQNTANNAQAQIQELIADSNGEEAGGVTITRRFNSSENGAGITNFTVDPSGKVGVLDGLARWYLTGTSGSTGEGHANHNTDSTVDDMENSITFGTNHSEIAYTGCYIRANAAMSYAWGIRVYYDQIQIGYISGWNGTSYTWNQVAQIIRNSYNGDTFRVRAVGDLYSVYHNGYPIYNATNAARPKGASYRDHGMWFGRAVNFGFYQSGAGVLQYAFAEIVPTPVLGTGWDFYRSSTSATSNLVTDYNPLSFTVFDTERRKANITVNNLGQGNITILKTGWYMVKVQYRMNRGADDYPPGERALLYYTRASTQVLCDVGLHNPSLAATRDCGDTFIEYFLAGDIVYPGFYYDKSITDAASTMVGDTLGTVTVFKGTLVSA